MKVTPMQSKNYVPGESGWSIREDGTVVFYLPTKDEVEA
jgi:hypothetical protein